MHRVVLATGNRGKAREISQLLGPGWQLLLQSELGVRPVAETGTGFAENALLKARHAAAATGLPALADDSGLEVDALGGAPGVRSARYAGEDASDADNVRHLLEEMAGLPAGSDGFFCSVTRSALWPGAMLSPYFGPDALSIGGAEPQHIDPEMSRTSAMSSGEGVWSTSPQEIVNRRSRSEESSWAVREMLRGPDKVLVRLDMTP